MVESNFQYEEREAEEGRREARLERELRFLPEEYQMEEHFINRIGSGCWYKPADVKGNKGGEGTMWKGGVLRAWSTDYEEYESGPALLPVAVIEDESTGMCSSIYVNRVSFSLERPEE